jgi:hypothetical protein
MYDLREGLSSMYGLGRMRRTLGHTSLVACLKCPCFSCPNERKTGIRQVFQDRIGMIILDADPDNFDCMIVRLVLENDFHISQS